MTNKPPDEVAAIGKRYGLEIGTRDNPRDAYSERGKWCLTKRGQTKVALACGITFDVVQLDANDQFVFCLGRFTMNKPPADHVGPTEVLEIGSCRHDTGKKNPQSTHAPEMAFKRMRVRGVIELAAAGVFYGEEEFDEDFFRSKQGAPPVAASNPAPSAQPPAATEPRLTEDQKVDRAKWGEAWNNICAQVSELTGLDRGAYERNLWTHCTMFKGAGGWVPARAANMADLYLAAKTPDKYGKWCGSTYGTAKKVVAALKEGGPFSLYAPNEQNPALDPKATMTISPFGFGGGGDDILEDPDLPL
jgi:hypothetical protein